MARMWTRLVALAAIALATAASGKETLYATSLRSQAGDASFIAGNLYVVDPSNAATTLIGAIKVGERQIGVVALATHPQTGVVYGISAGLSPAIPRSLLQIDLESATARLVAPLSVRGSDIGFDPQGELLMWAPDLHQIVRVDLETAAVTPIGHPTPSTASGAIAISEDGREALVAVNGAQGRMLHIDLQSGAVTEGAQLHGAPYDASMDNLTFSPEGALYAVNSDGGAPSKAALVIVDPATGAVRRIGALPDDVRGLIFAAERSRRSISRETVRLYALIALGTLAAGILLYALRR